jgi:hypothetical protein
MLDIFDELAATGTARLFGDSAISLLRQWLVRSDAWKRALGTAVSSLLFVALASGLGFSERASVERYNQAHKNMARSVSPFDRAAFSRSASQAVAMLARFQKDDGKRRRVTRRPIHDPAASTPPENHSHPD